MKKKAQTEIIGLAVVVILLIVGMTFVIRFTLNNEPTSARQDFLREQLASNTINTFLQTTSRDCNDLTMTQLIQDCAQSNIVVCENSMGSCEYVEFTARDLVLANTLDLWSIPYEFRIYRDETAPLIYFRIGMSGK